MLSTSEQEAEEVFRIQEEHLIARSIDTIRLLPIENLDRVSLGAVLGGKGIRSFT